MEKRSIENGAISQIYANSKSKTADLNQLLILDNLYNQLIEYEYENSNLYYQYHDSNHINYYLDIININDVFNGDYIFDKVIDQLTDTISFISHFTLNEILPDNVNEMTDQHVDSDASYYVLSCKGYIYNDSNNIKEPRITTVDEKFNAKLREIDDMTKNNDELNKKILQEVKKYKYLTGKEIKNGINTKEFLEELKERNQKLFDNLFIEEDKQEYDLRLFKDLEIEMIDFTGNFGLSHKLAFKCPADTALNRFIEDQLAMHNIDYTYKGVLSSPIYIHLSNDLIPEKTNYESDKMPFHNVSSWISFVGFSRKDGKLMFSILGNTINTKDEIKEFLSNAKVDMPKNYSADTLFNFINKNNKEQFKKYFISKDSENNKSDIVCDVEDHIVNIDPEIQKIMNDISKSMGVTETKIDRFESDRFELDRFDTKEEKEEKKNFQQCSHLEVKDEYSKSNNTLADLYNLQKDIQENVYGYDFEGMRKMDLLSFRQFFDWNYHAIQDELREMFDALGGVDDGIGNAVWKPWKKDHTEKAPNMTYNDMTETDKKELKMELIDIQHFLFNMMLAVGMTDDEIFNYYFSKNEENRNRQSKGY